MFLTFKKAYKSFEFCLYLFSGLFNTKLMVQVFKNHPYYAKLLSVLVLFNIFLHLDRVEEHFQPEKQISVTLSSEVCSQTAYIGTQDSHRSVIKLGFLFGGLSPSTLKNLTALPEAFIPYFTINRKTTMRVTTFIVLDLYKENTSGLSPPPFKI